MMSTFSAKSIGLYSLAIGGSIGFFQLVTSYGEANIRAPMAVTGIYAIADRNLSGCLQHQQLSLDLQQSGMYLNASLVAGSGKTPPTLAPRPTLSGQLHDRQLNLSGLLPTAICPQLSSVRITGSIATDRQLQGQIWLTDASSGSQRGTNPTSSEFTATRQSVANKAATTSH